MFIDYVMQICDRIMHQATDQNSSDSRPPSNTYQESTHHTDQLNFRIPTILLVEDHPVLLENLRCALEQSAYNVLTALSGESALDICRTHAGTIDVLVSDIEMGRITGFEVAATVRTAHPNAIVVLMSGSPLSSFPQQRVTHDFLEKPFPHEKLLTTISRRTKTLTRKK